MGAVLLVLVIVNAALTGWLLGTVKGMKRTIATVASAQKRIVSEMPYSTRKPVEFDELEGLGE